MKAIQFTAYGPPDQVCECTELDDVGAAGDGEVVVEIMASAINPADLLMIEGRYPGPTPPAQLGIEGAGRIVQVGAGVEGLAAGDHVISLERANWAQRVRVPAGRVIKIPAELPFNDAAMLKANPPSAHLMLTDYVDLHEGDWVIQNAANSAVGRHVIRLAKARGVKTVNVVRRESLIAELTGIGGDVVVVDGGDLAERVRAATGADANIALAIDAAGGHASSRLADCLSDGATVVNYGYLSGEPCMIEPRHTIEHGISLTGFWLVGFMQRSTPEQIAAMYADMASKFMDGTLSVPVEATYPITEAKAALAHAMRESRDGKVILLPNG